MKTNAKLTIFKISFLLIFIFSITLNAQNEKVRMACIAFYNVENLFDTINDPNINDVDFTPTGDYRWTSERYNEKLKNLSFVIDKIGNKYNNMRPAIIGLSEVENRAVLEDLVATDLLKPHKYKIVHYDSPDRRGIDVALIYQEDRFKVISSSSHRLILESHPDLRTRDPLLVTGIMDGDTLDIIVNHWPSRRGGQKTSAPLRNAAAKLNRQITDSILNVRPNAKVIIMGDLNDDPDNDSVLKYLRAKGNKNKLAEGDLYNATWDLFKKGIGTLAYRGQWNLFDQIIVSQGLLNNNKESYELFSTHVFNENFLVTQEGRFMGYPFRTFSGNSYIGGFSDHFPSYIIIVKKIN